MGKNPAFQFYPSDWTRDLDDQDLEVEGAWIRICCRLWWSEKRGEASKPLQEWARILRKSERKTKEIFQILLDKHIASGSVLDNQNITIISRRMVRDFEISELRKRVGKLGGNPGLKKIQNNLDNQNASKSASLLLQSSTSKKDIPPIIPLEGDGGLKNENQKGAGSPFVKPTLDEIRAYCAERGNTVDPQTWLDHYTSNGWKVGKNKMVDWRAAVRTWEASRKTDKQGGLLKI